MISAPRALFEALIDRNIRRVVVASSMSIYGEGLYRTADGGWWKTPCGMPRMSPAASWDPLDEHGRPAHPRADTGVEAAIARLRLCAHQISCRSS